MCQWTSFSSKFRLVSHPPFVIVVGRQRIQKGMNWRSSLQFLTTYIALFIIVVAHDQRVPGILLLLQIESVFCKHARSFLHSNSAMKVVIPMQFSHGRVGARMRRWVIMVAVYEGELPNITAFSSSRKPYIGHSVLRDPLFGRLLSLGAILNLILPPKLHAIFIFRMRPSSFFPFHSCDRATVML
jgi:hypothetical protein